MAYSDAFKNILADPPNAGTLDSPDAFADGTNPVCGDRLQLSLRITDDRITHARFLAYGCPPTIVCGSALASTLEGRTLDEAAAITRQDLINLIGGLPARKHHAAALAVETLRDTLDAFRDK